MAGFEGTLDELFDAGRSHARCWTSAAARACSCSAGRNASATRRVVGIDLEEESIQAGWAERQAPNLEYRVMRAEVLPFAEASSTWRPRSRCSSTFPTRSGTLAEMARCAERHLLVSVPREPLWRMLNMARGSYWSALGNTPGPSQPLVQALVREAARAPRRGRRGPLAVPLDDAACPPLAARRAPTAAARGYCRSGSPRPGCSRSRTSRSPATCSAKWPASESTCCGRSCS